jgi:hypothetical protein
VRPSVRASKTARPALVIRRSRMSRSAWATLTRLQMLRGFRGEKRIEKLSASSRRRTPSIQPKQRASSSAPA